MTLTRLPTITLAMLSIVTALGSWRFMLVGLEAAFSGPPFDTLLENGRWVFAAHVVAAPIALALGTLQFFPRFRASSIGRHRAIGWVYGLSILVGGVSAILLTLSMTDRPVAALGFFLLGVFWLATTGYGIALASQGQIGAHGDWMIRSFALTASALTLRIYLGAATALGYDYVEVSHILGWACWVPNLILAEWLIARRARPQHRALA